MFDIPCRVTRDARFVLHGFNYSPTPLIFNTNPLETLQMLDHGSKLKKVSEYDQEIPQSQTVDNPVAPQGRAAQPSRDTRKTN